MFAAFRAIPVDLARVVSPLLPLDLARDPEETLRRELDAVPLAFLRHVRFIEPDRTRRPLEGFEDPLGETGYASRSVTEID